jgi:hypothetical protein
MMQPCGAIAKDDEMKSKRRKLVRRSFMAVVTGTSALALQACGSGDSEPPSNGNNSAEQSEPASDSDSG